eukprot:COSAG02_NODE_16352_length_1090_cov_3.044400_1_plen_181_part_01
MVPDELEILMPPPPAAAAPTSVTPTSERLSGRPVRRSPVVANSGGGATAQKEEDNQPSAVPAFGVGDKVTAMYGKDCEGPKSYPATIAAAHTDGTYSLEWEDGDEKYREWRLASSLVLRRRATEYDVEAADGEPSPAPEPAPAPAPPAPAPLASGDNGRGPRSHRGGAGGVGVRRRGRRLV